MWQITNSSNISAIKWEKGNMQVKFKTGAIYQYAGVPEEKYQLILQAESVGRAFNKLVKAFPELYPYTKVG